jgi:ureidoglycolate dehydrogenase (NAD+)
MAEEALVNHVQLQEFVAALFESAGMGKADAGTVADILVWADLRGVESHGVERVPRYLALLKGGQMQATAVPEIQEVAGAAFRVDAMKAVGPVGMMRAVDEAAVRARTSGVALGVIANATHTGAIGYYAEKAARQGLAAIVMAAGMPLMAWPGTKAPSISTSPVAIGVPGGPDGVMVFDMSTAIAASGRLRKATLDKKPIPEGWALDADGNPATDPGKAVTSLPVGGAKGAGLSLMIEILAGILGGTPIVAPMLQPGGEKRHAANGLVILIDIARFRPLADFAGDVDLLCSVIKGMPRFEDAEAVRMPGERGNAELRARQAHGVPLSARLAGTLAGLGTERGIAVPQALEAFA